MNQYHMNLKEIKYDCKYFKGHIPCEPNKKHNLICDSCEEYEQIKTRVLIIKLGAIGDVIRSTPLITKLRQLHPSCHITWLTLTPQILPPDEIDEILNLNYISLFKLSHLQFNIAINLDKDPEICMLMSDIDATEKYGFTWKNGHIASFNDAAEKKLLTGLFDSVSKKNTKSYLEEIFEICGFKYEGEEYLLNKNIRLTEKWQRSLKKISGSNKFIIGLNTGCGDRWPTRLWPDDYWIQLIQHLTQKGYFCLLLGGAAEDEKNKMISLKTDAYYPGNFSLEEFISISSVCNLIVTQVSMMMHIATGLKKKLVLMNNIFNKHEFELFGRGIIIEPESGCDCYYGTTCKRELNCMNDINSETVANAVFNLIPLE